MKTTGEILSDARTAISAFKKKNQEVRENNGEQLKNNDEVAQNILLNPLYTAKESLAFYMETVKHDDFSKTSFDMLINAVKAIDDIINRVKNYTGDDFLNSVNSMNILADGIISNMNYCCYRYVLNSDTPFFYKRESCCQYTELKKDMLKLLAKNSRNTLNVLFMPLDQSDKLSEEYHEIEKEHEKYKINQFAIYSDNDFNIQRDIYKQVAIGDIENIICSNSVFDVVDLRFSITKANVYDSKVDNDFGERCLNKAMLYVKDNGYIFININAAYITRNIMKILADNGKIMAIFCDKDANGYEKGTEYMILYKRKKLYADVNGSAFRKLRDEYNNNKCTITNINHSINIEELINKAEINEFNASIPYAIRIFRGNLPDVYRLTGVLEKSSAFSVKENMFAVKPKPLLPLTKGQIGQVLVSGNLNGIVDEGDGHRHVIKGLTKKEQTIVSEEYQSVENIPQYANRNYLLMKKKKYISNAVSLMVLTPEGTQMNL